MTDDALHACRPRAPRRRRHSRSGYRAKRPDLSRDSDRHPSHHPLLGHEVAALDAPRQVDLVVLGEQRRAPDVLEEAAEDDSVLLLAVRR